MSRAPDLELRLLNTIENVSVVHRALTGTAIALSLSALEADGLITAVEEVCKNVVHHAYDGAEGPLELQLRVLPAAIEAIVRDEGYGIRPHLGERSLPHTGIGLPMVHSLTRSITYSNREPNGTEVVMELPAPSVEVPESHLAVEDNPAPAARPRPRPRPAERELAPQEHAGSSAAEDPDRDTVQLSLACGRLLEPVLAGIVLELAGRGGLQEPVARSLVKVATALAQGALEHAGLEEPRDGDGSRTLNALLALSAQQLEIRVWPVRPAAGAQALSRARNRVANLPEADGVKVGLEPGAGEPALVVRARREG